MSVNDDEAMRPIVEQEGLANPPQIGLFLVTKLDARTNSGMDK
jgi:hypothetical protein